MSELYTLITGASGGIGLELARQFAKNGHNLILVGRGNERLKTIGGNLAMDYSIIAHVIESDLATPASAQKLFKIISKNTWRVNILVNNAGFGLGGKFATQDIATLTRMMQLNMITLTQLSRLLIPDMIKLGGGQILNVASTAAFLPGPFMAVYYATKAFVFSFSRALAYEVQPYGVSVTVLCPGPTKTHFAATANVQKSPLFSGHLMSPEQVAVEAYAGLAAGREVIIPGWRNKLWVAIIRWLPPWVVMRAAKKIQKP